LAGNFELVFEADWDRFEQNVALRASSGEEITFQFYHTGRSYISFGNTNSAGNWDFGDANVLRLTVTGDVAKLYVNDVVLGTAVVNPSVTYSSVVISGITRDDKLYSVTATQR
jgi:hypothetical protein